jgi:hypothetical protein
LFIGSHSIMSYQNRFWFVGICFQWNIVMSFWICVSSQVSISYMNLFFLWKWALSKEVSTFKVLFYICELSHHSSCCCFQNFLSRLHAFFSPCVWYMRVRTHQFWCFRKKFLWYIVLEVNQFQTFFVFKEL